MAGGAVSLDCCGVRRRCDAFTVLVVLFQLGMAAAYSVLVEYGPNVVAASTAAQTSVGRYYPFYQDIAVMIFVGIGFLMTFAAKYRYSSLGFTFLVATFCLQWTMLCTGFFEKLHEQSLFDGSRIPLSMTSLVDAMFGAATVLISVGVVIGKTTPGQLLVMAFVELIFYSLNFYIGNSLLHAIDVGGTMYIHLFAAYFGVATSTVLGPAKPRRPPPPPPPPHVGLADDAHHATELPVHTRAARQQRRAAIAAAGYAYGTPSTHTSDTFTMIGTLFLWMYWPSFNGAFAPDASQLRVILNTLLSLCACAVSTFVFSRLLRSPEHKFDMTDIQNATLAGGVAMGTCADLMIGPGVAISIGMAAGLASTLGYVFLQPKLEHIFTDTCGVHNLHALPGLLGAFAGAIATGVGAQQVSLYGPEYSAFFYHGTQQGLYQLAVIAITIGIALASGYLNGAILRAIAPLPDALFSDATAWRVPPDFDDAPLRVPLPHHHEHAQQQQQQQQWPSSSPHSSIELAHFTPTHDTAVLLRPE